MAASIAVTTNRTAMPSRSEPDVVDGFAAFYTTHIREVIGLAYTLTGSWQVAEDLAQEAFVRAYRDWRKVGAFDRPDSWVRTVAVNLVKSRSRRLVAEAKALARLRTRQSTQHGDPLPEDAEAFWSAVRSLPARQATAVALRYHSDLSVDQVAEVMSCAPGTVKAHLHAARQALRSALDPDEREDAR